jgi:hypothetical protein
VVWSSRRWTDVFTEQAGMFRDAVGAADPAARVPSCPGWTFTELTVHVGRFLAQVSRYLTSGSTVQLRPPADERPADPVGYLDKRIDEAIDVLTSAPGRRPVWTFSPAAPDLAWVWHRRAAHELNLRRWDAQAALRTLVPTDRDQAADAIDELLGTLLAARLRTDSPPRTTGTAVVSASDGPERWYVRFTPGEVPLVRQAARDETADAHLDGRTENLLYQLWSRMQLTASGDEDVLRALRMS